MGKQPIKFKMDVAMIGKLGYDIPVNELPKNYLLFSQDPVKLYNGFKDVLWYGDQYRLRNPDQQKVASMAYVNASKDTAIVFNYLMSSTYQTTLFVPIKMQGLDPLKNYKIEKVNLYPGTRSAINGTKIYSGDFLMKAGFNPDINSRRTSVVLRIAASDKLI